MENYIIWGAVGLLLLFLLIGFLAGIVRGLKRSSLHMLFLIGSMVLSFFITKPVTNLILDINFTIDGSVLSISEYILKMVQTNFDISQFGTATEFLNKIPSAIVAPILFILLTLVVYFIFDIIYLIVARVSFGSKKKDFQTSKPRRLFGGAVGMVEGFLFLFILFAPLTSLTKTYQDIVVLPTSQTHTLEEGTGIKPLGELLSGLLPETVNEIIFAYNDSVVGKIAGAGGLDNALFDGLSNFEINGEKIAFRKEIIAFTKVYDEFVVIYNDIIEKNYELVDFSDFKISIEKVLNNGFFKAVVSDTIKEAILNFEEIKVSLNLPELPQLVQDIITELHSSFSADEFEAYEYIKHDILKILDVAEKLFESSILEDYSNLPGMWQMVDLLEIVEKNNEVIGEIAQDILNLNIVRDTFNPLLNFASEQISTYMENDKGLEIALNTNITDKDQMIDDLLGAVTKLLDINSDIDITAFLESEDILETIFNIGDLGNVFPKIGSLIDDLRELELFVLPVTSERLEKVYVLDNILKLYELDILNDEVYLTPQSETKTKLDTYTKFFEFIKTPIMTLQGLGLTDIMKEGTSFDDILNKLMDGLEANESLLSDLLLPFYQLNALNLKGLVFDTVVDQFGNPENTNGIIDFSGVQAEAALDSEFGGVPVWHRELVAIGKVLNSLNTGAIDVDGEDKTYLLAILSGEVEFDAVINEMVNANDLEAVLDAIFSAKSFEGLTADIFDIIDSSIESLTGVKPATSLANLETTKAEVIQIINELLTITLNNDLTSAENSLTLAGQILDALKENSYNEGAKDGVFNEIFANLIWYMTGDDVTGTGKFVGSAAIDVSADIKAYFNVTGTNNFEGYYLIESFEEEFSSLQKILDLAEELEASVGGIVLDIDTIETFVENIKNTMDGLTGTEAQKAELLNDLRSLMEKTGNEILSSADIDAFGDDLADAIDAELGIGDLADALKNLLGL